jgi:hypothetical protein
MQDEEITRLEYHTYPRVAIAEEANWYEDFEVIRRTRCKRFHTPNINTNSNCECCSQLPLTEMSKEFNSILFEYTGRKFNQDEWDLARDGKQRPISFRLGTDEDPVVERCICTHNIYELCFIVHIPTGEKFQVGTECVQKISPLLYNEVKRKLCKLCEEFLPDKRRLYQNKGYCSVECYLEGEFRPCDGCGKYEIAKKEPLWKSNCKSCYIRRIRKNEQEQKNKSACTTFRICCVCGKYNIRTDEPLWKKKCIECFKKRRRN